MKITFRKCGVGGGVVFTGCDPEYFYWGWGLSWAWVGGNINESFFKYET